MSLIHGASWVMLIRVAGAGLTFLSQAMLARWLGAFEFGVFAYAWVWVTIIGFVAPLGISGAVVKFLPDYVTRGKWRRARGLIRFSRTTVLLSGLASGALFALTILLLGEQVPAHYRLPLYLAAATMPVMALIDLHQELSRSFGWMRLAYFPTYVLRPAALLALVGVLVYSSATITATSASAAALVACLVTLGAQAATFRRRLTPDLSTNRATYHTRHWLQAAFPFLFIEAAYLVLENTDVIMLGYFTEPENVAIYYAVIRISSLLGFIAFAVSALAAPRFSTLSAQGKTAEMQRYYRQSIHLTLWPSIALGALLLAFGESILAFFGPQFTAGYPALAILVGAILIEAAFGPVSFLLSMTGHQAATARTIGYTAAINIILNAILIPQWGLIGAATATALSIILRTIWFVVLARHRLGISASPIMATAP